jgi:hypothetical protein
MKQFLTAVLFLPLFTSLGTGAEYGFDDHPNMPAAVAQYKHTLRAIKQSGPIPTDDHKGWEDFKKVLEEHDKSVKRILSCEYQLEDDKGNGSPRPPVNIMLRRLVAMDEVVNELDRLIYNSPALSPVTSLEMTGEYGLDNPPGMPEAVEALKQSLTVILQLHNTSDRTPSKKKRIKRLATNATIKQEE